MNIIYCTFFSTYTIQVETNIIGNIISSGERVMNSTYLTKLIHGSKRYAQTYRTEVDIQLRTIFHQKLKVFLPDCVDNFP